MQHAVSDNYTNLYKKMKGPMSILSEGANATARHGIDSKLKTMSGRITENPAGCVCRGDCLILYFQ